MQARDIILRPIITEASTSKNEDKVYQFEVNRQATKLDVKKAIKEIFDVKVKKVNVLNIHGKKKRMGRYEGYKPKRRKAIVSLTPSSKAIEIFKNQNNKNKGGK